MIWRNAALIGSLGLLLCACSHISMNKTAAQKKFVIEKSWARHTVQGEYLGSRVNHVMEPLLFADLVISGNEIDSIVAYDQHSGQKKWAKLIDGGITASAKAQDGAVYFGAGDGFFYAVDAKTGMTKWSFPIRAEGIGTPLVDGDAVYFLAGNNAAYALKKNSGEQIWFYSRVDSQNITVRGASEPSASGNRLYLGFSDGFLVALDKQKGTLVWERQLSNNARFRDVDSKPVIDGSRIFISSYDGQLYCLNAQNGAVEWVHDEGGFTPVTVAGETLYYSTSTRKVQALDKNSGKVIWGRDLIETVAGQPVVLRGLVFFGEWNGTLRAVDARTGADVTHFATGRGVTSRPALDVKKDAFFVMTADGNLFALNLKLKGLEEAWPWEK